MKKDYVKKTQNERISEITDQLEQGVKGIYESDNYRNYLNTMSKFHNYSLNNTILICAQKPEATLVAGFNSWKTNFNRSVNKGEKGIKIIAPYKVKKEVEVIDKETGKKSKEEQEQILQGFKVIHVFDVSQTSGEPLPTIEIKKLEDNLENFQSYKNALIKISPCPIKFDEISSSANGFYNLTDNEIVIKNGLPESQTIKTMVHEITHATLHKDRKTEKRMAEVQAESVAYVVCNHLGIKADDYSFGYIGSWSSGKEIKELKSSLDVIKTTSSDIIDKFSAEISREISQDKVQSHEIKTEQKPILNLNQSRSR